MSIDGLAPFDGVDDRARRLIERDNALALLSRLGACMRSSVILVNLFQVDQADIPALLKAWEDDANWMKRQPGYISTQLHQAIGGSAVFPNLCVGP